MMVVLSILSFIFILGGLVFIHECGHFFAAKLFGVGVEEFGIGFPPRLASIRRGTTVYSLNWIPLGGFVKVKGMIDGDTSDQTDFMSRPLWQRTIILCAGIAMNAVLTVVLFTIGYSIGMPGSASYPPAGAVVSNAAVIVADISVDAPAHQAGLAVGDTIRSINGEPIATVADVRTQLSDISTTTLLTVTVDRTNEAGEVAPVTLEFTPIELSDTNTLGIGAYFIESGTIRLPLVKAFTYSVQQTWQFTIETVRALVGVFVQLFTRGTVDQAVSGPVGVATLTYQATQLGFIYVLQLAAILSLNLAIFNVLPFPALDGGRLLFVVIELFWRKPLHQKVEAIIHNIGFIVLLGLILAVTVKDFFTIF